VAAVGELERYRRLGGARQARYLRKANDTWVSKRHCGGTSGRRQPYIDRLHDGIGRALLGADGIAQPGLEQGAHLYSAGAVRRGRATRTAADDERSATSDHTRGKPLRGRVSRREQTSPRGTLKASCPGASISSISSTHAHTQPRSLTHKHPRTSDARDCSCSLLSLLKLAS